MADPTLKRTSVVIKYTSSDGYRMSFEAKGGTGIAHRLTGEQVPPQHAFLAAVGELARMTALFGFEDEAKTEFDKAVTAIREWRGSKP